jgi:acyl-CoA synthetase (AMP-forming)/AMP-acid ligase II
LIEEDGYLHILDRLKDIIIVGASNVYPSDLETVLDDCAEIREAAVIGRPDDELGEDKHPRDVIFLQTLPRDWHGKVDRRSLHDIVTTLERRSTNVLGRNA